MNSASAVRVAGVTDLDEAEQLVSQVFLPNRLRLPTGSRSVDMDFSARRLGDLSAGLLSYGDSVRMVTADAANFHVNVPLQGTAMSKTGVADAVPLERGQAGVFPPGAPADIGWSDHCVQLCLMVPRAALEGQLERLLGRSLDSPLAFAFTMDLRGETGRRWHPSLRLVHDVLTDQAALADLPVAARHVESVVMDGLLIAQPHNYTELLHRPAPTGRLAGVSHAVSLMEERPQEPWSSTGLAQAVHLSVRALQEGFQRQVGQPPMAYLRQVRLRRVREVLVDARGGSTTVRSVATEFGFLHMSRFASAYQQAFGELPSATLAREP